MVSSLAPSSEDAVREGDVLAGKYRIERVLGRGGMGVVVSAVHLKLDERVAIKFLLPAATDNPEAIARFEREARAAVKIKSEHVARVIDVGTLDTGAPYIVMEHLEGCDLSVLVRQRRNLPIEEAVEYVLQACEAIAEAHSIGIVHRDLKPNNLFLTHRADGTPAIKVLDFGISKLLPGASTSEPQAAMTSTDSLLGSPIYMSPEQMTNPRGVDARADVWALGATLFKLVTGKAPFDGESIPQICGMIMMGAPSVPLRSLFPDAPEALEALIARCLQKQPGDRFANVADLAAALEEFAPARALVSVERARRVMESAGVGPRVPVPPPPNSSPSWSSAKSSSSPRVAISTASKSLPSALVSSGDAALSAPPPSATGRTLESWTSTGTRRRSASRRFLVASGVLGVLALGVALGALLRRSPGEGSATVASGGPLPAAPTTSATSDAPAASTTATSGRDARPSGETSSATATTDAPAATDAAPSAASKPSGPSRSGAGREKPGAKQPKEPKPAEPAPAPVAPPPPVTPKKKPSGELFDERL